MTVYPTRWKVHTPNLLKEILGNNECQALRVPIAIFGEILYAVGERSAELNDPLLNDLMCRLAIYSVADPLSEDYDKEAVDEVRKAAERMVVS